ncbi:Rrf2 family transcriptional regulator [Kitasatospora cheerisanensis KCTC 2395]|uniref:Rrf2 family transcriptional regulator n=1 Tax=Kitasatospora cheerisanensis KCTC 2395 TaxID=1348663 RepID=A0A066YMD4_9ACTN|nr:Rrf2 family transcriptional regulator [Kitasatospora cheerisanensis KCTC 2395]
MGAALLPHPGVAGRTRPGALGSARGDVRAVADVPQQGAATAHPGGPVDVGLGPRGGVRLARDPGRITMMDVVTAVEGADPLFACAEIRQRGVSAEGAADREFARPCGIAAAMRRAELAWRRELAARTVAELAREAPAASVARVRRNYARLASAA